MAEPGDAGRAITPTQLLLHTLQEAEEPLSVHQLMGCVGRIVESLRRAGFELDVFFRGPYCGNVWSEQFEHSLWYWLSNGFVEEDAPTRGLRLSASGRRLFEDDELAAAIHRNLDEQTLSELTSTIRETLVAPSE